MPVLGQIWPFFGQNSVCSKKHVNCDFFGNNKAAYILIFISLVLFVEIEMNMYIFNSFWVKVSVILPWVIFILLHKFCKETRCFLGNFAQLENFYTTANRAGRDKFQVCAGNILKASGPLSMPLSFSRMFYKYKTFMFKRNDRTYEGNKQ